VNQRPEVGLLLDEMFSPAIAAELSKGGHDVIAVADRPDLRSKSDEEIFAWASTQQRWLLTEKGRARRARTALELLSLQCADGAGRVAGQS
jgi:hypothetical protein